MGRARYAGGRTRYGRRRRSGEGLKNWLWGGLIVVVLASVGTGAWLVRREVSGDAIDEITLCPVDGATGQIAVLLDLTDPLGATQLLSLRALLDRSIERSQRGTLISLGRVSDDPTELGARVAICKPMTGDEAGEIYRNPKQVEARYQQAFVAPLAQELTAMLDASEASQSPVMEGLQALLAGTATVEMRAAAPRQLVIVSDLLQHSEVMSFYRGGDWESFRASPAFARLARNLDGVDVTIVRVPRPDARIDWDDVEDFWVRYLDAQGAASVLPESLGDL